MVYEIHSLLGEEVERHRLGRVPVFRAYHAMEQGVLRPAEIVRIGLRLASDPDVAGKTAEELASVGTGDPGPRRDR